MSETRKAIVEFAHANIYWYTHQNNLTAMKNANCLEETAIRFINEYGKGDERIAFQQACWRTLCVTSSTGGS